MIKKVNRVNNRNPKSKIDENGTLNTHYSLFISVIAVGVWNLIVHLIGILSNGIIYFLDNNTINVLVTISMFYVVTALILIELCIGFYCFAYLFHSLNNKWNSMRVLKSYLLVIFQCIIYSFSLFIILFNVILTYHLTKYNLYYSSLVLVIAICLYHEIWKWSNKKNINILPNFKAVIYTTFLMAIFLGGSFYYCTYIISPIKIEKEIYTYQDQEVIIKIPADTSDIEVFRDGGRIIPFRKYYLDYNAYLIIDFSLLAMVEGKYHVKAIINGEITEKEFLYIFKGTWDDKNKYIDKYFTRAKNEINDKSKDYILINLKEVALSGNKEKYNKILKEKSKMLPPEAIGILNELSLDKVFFY